MLKVVLGVEHLSPSPNKKHLGFSLTVLFTVASRLSTHPFKYALFSRKNRVQEIGAGVAGYGDQGTVGLQQNTNTTSVSTAGTINSLESKSQQQNANEFNQGPPAYDETSNRDELEQTLALGVVEGDQPQLGTDQVAATHQPVEEETSPTSNLNQESNLPQEEMHDLEL